jgi:hypothetical protein
VDIRHTNTVFLYANILLQDSYTFTLANEIMRAFNNIASQWQISEEVWRQCLGISLAQLDVCLLGEQLDDDGEVWKYKFNGVDCIVKKTSDLLMVGKMIMLLCMQHPSFVRPFIWSRGGQQGRWWVWKSRVKWSLTCR